MQTGPVSNLKLAPATALEITELVEMSMYKLFVTYWPSHRLPLSVDFVTHAQESK